MINSFVGRDKIIWGTWDLDLPEDKLDVVFEKLDLREMIVIQAQNHIKYTQIK